MSNFMIVVSTLLGFSLVASLFIYLTVLDAGKWRKKIETALVPMGFEVCISKDEKASMTQRLLMVNPLHQGKRLLMHLYRRASPHGSHDLYFCDYRFASSSGKARGAQWLLVCLISRELDLPRFSINNIPETSGVVGRLYQSLSKAFPMLGLERIKTGDAEFDERFCVYADTGQVKLVLPLLEQITTALRAKGGTCLDAQGDCLILFSIEMNADLPLQVLDSQKLIRLINVASNLFETVRHQARV
jgi:hypothetical protein